MKQTTNKALDKITDIIAAKGSDLSQADRLEIDVLSTDIAPEDMADVWPSVEEAIWLIVADPLYEGDIELDAD